MMKQILAVVMALVMIGSAEAKTQPKAKPEQKKPALMAHQPWESPAPAVAAPAPTQQEIAGKIFDMPVSKGNYFFAKAVAYIFPRPWGAADLPEADREKYVWESLILHYESYRRNIQISDEELEKAVNQLLKDQKQTFTRQGDPIAYQKWVNETLKEQVELFENQIKFLLAIRDLKDQVVKETEVAVTDEEMHQEFLNEQNHVGGEMVTFHAKEEADDFYKKYKNPKAWDAMKKSGKFQVRPVSLMTLEAYMDLWSIPKDQMYAFHALPLGSVGEPMPFGKDWCVYHLLDKRTGDLKDFPKQRDSYFQQVQMKKKYDAMKQWIEDLKNKAKLETYTP